MTIQVFYLTTACINKSNYLRQILVAKINCMTAVISNTISLCRVDLKRRHVEWDFHLDKLQFLGKYKVSGQVLILPITGDGDANITLCK